MAGRSKDESPPADRYAAMLAQDEATRKYLLSLKPSSCPVCGRPQKTPRGEALACPKCVEGKDPKSVKALRERALGPGVKA